MSDASTPRPWSASYGRLVRIHRGAITIGGVHRVGRFSSSAPNGIAEANAALIVRSVNAHDDLVAALKAAMKLISRGYQPPELIAQANAALAKAGKP